MAVLTALLAVSRLLIIRIPLFGPTVLMRTLSRLALHLRLQALSTALCGSPFGPWIGIKLMFRFRVIGVLNKKLCVLALIIPATFVPPQCLISKLTSRVQVPGLLSKSAILWKRTLGPGQLRTSPTSPPRHLSRRVAVATSARSSAMAASMVCPKCTKSNSRPIPDCSCSRLKMLERIGRM